MRLPTSIAVMPPGPVQAPGPVLEHTAEMTLYIKQYDRQILELTQTVYPETQALLKVHGVGHGSDVGPYSGKSNASSQVGTWVAISGCDHDAVSLAIVILNSASPRPATSICEVF